jgi:hypothetical protein
LRDIRQLLAWPLRPAWVRMSLQPGIGQIFEAFSWRCLQVFQFTTTDAMMGKNTPDRKGRNAAGIRRRMITVLRPYLTGTST